MNQCKSGLNEVNLAGGVNDVHGEDFSFEPFCHLRDFEFLAGNNNGCFCSRSETMNLQKREPDMNGHHTGKQTSSRDFKSPSFPRRIGSNTA